jgi:hypothetical protein
MNLYHDRISGSFTLETEDEVLFLGPMTFALKKLKKDYGLTDSQAREAVLRAYALRGDAVDLDIVKRMA